MRLGRPVLLLLFVDLCDDADVPEVLSDHADHLLEHFGHSRPRLRRNCKVRQVLQRADAFGRVLGSYIAFVADQHAEGRVLLVLVVELEPGGAVLEGLRMGAVVDEEAEVGVLEVAGDEAFEAFLAGSVPELNAVLSLVGGDVFDEEVDADGGLS